MNILQYNIFSCDKYKILPQTAEKNEKRKKDLEKRHFFVIL